MKNLALLVLFTWSAFTLYAQVPTSPADSVPQYRLPYKIWVQQRDSSLRRRGIYRTTDTSILFLKTRNRFSVNTPTEEVLVKNILSIEYRKRNKIGRYIRNGVLIGLGIGATIGAATYEPCDRPGWGCLFAPRSRVGAAGLGGYIGGVTGFWSGLISGAINKQIAINGSPKSYQAQRERLKALGVTGF
jgi:hypothetical protein